MKKIFTIRSASEQRSFLWKDHIIEEEIAACDDRNIKFLMFKYLPKEEQILEAGCGLGAWVIFLKRRGYAIAGIDHDTNVISQLKEWDPSLDVVGGDISSLSYGDNSLGGYISLGVVEHFEEGPQKPLAEAFRVLRPGGIMVLTVPFNNLFRRLFAHPLRSLYLFLSRMKGRRSFFAEYRYSEREVHRMIESAGFKVIETDIDDFIPLSMSLTLWSEFPFLQDREKLYRLNPLGRMLASILNSISRKIIVSGLAVIAEKPGRASDGKES